jgi:4'-phosphopantetheinyl transferase
VLAVYVVDLESGTAALEGAEAETPRLSEGEEARAATIPDAARRSAWRASHIALRIVLERWAGKVVRGEPLRHGPSGRPSLPAPAPDFSLSHTDGMALIACASYGPVGVDVERDRDIALSPERRAMMIAAANGLRPGDHLRGQPVTMLQAWTRLEALGKALGTGIGSVLTAAREDAAAGLGHIGRSDHSSVSGLLATADLCVVDLPLAGPYHGALAAPRGDSPPLIVPLPADPAGLRAFAKTRDCVDLPDPSGQKGA